MIDLEKSGSEQKQTNFSYPNIPYTVTSFMTW